MNKETIAIARQRLDLPDSMTDEEIADGLRGSSLEAKIEFGLACKSLGGVIQQCVNDTVAAFRDVGSKLRPYGKEGNMEPASSEYGRLIEGVERTVIRNGDSMRTIGENARIVSGRKPV